MANAHNPETFSSPDQGISSQSVLRWGWLVGSRKQPQLETFPTADEALDAMRKRQSSDCTWSVEDCAHYGFYLARVLVTVEAQSVMMPVR